MSDFFKQFGGSQVPEKKPTEVKLGAGTPKAPATSKANKSDFFSQFGGTTADTSEVTSSTPPGAVVTNKPVTAAQDPQSNPAGYEQVQKIKQRPFFDAPLLKSEETTDQELEAIAQKHKVDPQVVKDLSTYFGAIRSGGNVAEEIESSLARGVGLNIPQLVGKKQLPDNVRAAVDDIQDLADQKRSFARGITENIIPVGLAGKAAGAAIGLGKEAVEQGAKALIRKGAEEGAVYGAGAGLGRSREGEEFFSSFGGAVLGGALGATVPAAISGINKLANRTAQEIQNPVEKQIIGNYLEQNNVQLDRAATELAQSRKAVDDIVEQSLISGEAPEGEDAARIVATYLDPDQVNKYMLEGTEAGTAIRSSLPEEDIANLGAQKAIEKKLAAEIVLDKGRAFLSDLNGTTPKSLEDISLEIRGYANRQGDKATRDLLSVFREEQAALDYIKQKAIRTGRQDKFTDKGINLISDAQFVLRDIDERVGTKLEPIHREMNQAYNRLSFVRNAFRDKLTNIFVKNRNIDNELVEGGEVYKALDTGDISRLNPEQVQAYEQFKQFFDDGLKFVNGLSKDGETGLDPSIAPLNIPAQKNYVPYMLASPEDLVTRFASVYREALQDASKLAQKELQDFTDVTPREFNLIVAQSSKVRNLLAGIQTFDSQNQIVSGQDLMSSLRSLLGSRDGQIKIASAAKAALEREGNIPQWMRETNLYKLADRWTSNTLKHLYLRNSINKMASEARRLDAAGASVETAYVRNLLQDIQGIRRGTAAEQTARGKMSYLSAIDRITNDKGPAGKAVGAIAKALPEVFSDMMKQIYPNLLGMSPRALIMNLTQTISKTAPELGTKYGYYAVARGAANAALNYPKQVERLKELGLQPADFVRKYSRTMAEGIRRHAIYAIPNDVLNRMGDAAMFLYTKMDTLNRVITLGAADQLAYDLSKGSKNAREVLYRMPATVRRQVDMAKTEEEIAKILASHLNASTQFNYNRLSMSEFGRTMGPLFSTFSKWPTATAGEIVQEYRNKGLVKGSKVNFGKYVAPLMLLQLMDIGIFGYDSEKPWQENEENRTDRMKKLFGATGLSQSAPIGAAAGILKGDFFTPPIVDAVMKGVVLPTMEQDGDKLIKGIDSTVQNFTPGSVWVRFLTDDLVTFLEGERPEGNTFMERTISGAEELTK